jgi:hypothetical protein
MIDSNLGLPVLREWLLFCSEMEVDGEFYVAKF